MSSSTVLVEGGVNFHPFTCSFSECRLLHPMREENHKPVGGRHQDAAEEDKKVDNIVSN